MHDADIFLRGVDNLVVEGRGGIDVANAQGEAGTGAPATHRVELHGHGGGDALVGGNAGDVLDGGPGGDALHGDGGFDTIEAAGGGAGDDDLVVPGEGGGQVSYRDAGGPVRVDLAITGHQDTGGGGTDRIVADEVIGSAHADVLRGNAAANVLDGGAGNDSLEGRAGADHLIGGDGGDTVSYASSPAGVQVSLARGTACGGHAHGDLIAGESSERLARSACRRPRGRRRDRG